MNYPNRFGHDPKNIVGWMMRYAFRRYIQAYKQRHKLKEVPEYVKISNKFITRHAEYILKMCESDAKVVARKAYDIEIQRKDHALQFSVHFRSED